MKYINILFTLFSILLIVFGCGSSIDKDNFEFKDYLVGNDDLIAELVDWDVDTAYIQFIGFPPNPDYESYKDLAMDMKLSGVYPEEFFDKFDLNHPIIVVWALRKNKVSGNSFDDAGLGSQDLIDYGSGIGKRDARNLHGAGDYVYQTYEYSSFYLAFIDGEYKLLSSGYEEDRDCIDLFDDLIKLDKKKSKEYIKASNEIGLYIKGKPIKMIEPSRLNKIQMENLVTFDWNGDEDGIWIEIDEKINGINYKILDKNFKLVESGRLYKNQYNNVGLKNIEKGIFYLEIGKDYKRKLIKKSESINSESINSESVTDDSELEF
jgi:hypothetical protein